MIKRTDHGLDDGIEHLHCGHCGSLDELVDIDFKLPAMITTNPMAAVRTLCSKCRLAILEWI